MDQERHHRDALVGRAIVLILLRPNLAQHHGVDDLEVRGIGGE